MRGRGNDHSRDRHRQVDEFAKSSRRKKSQGNLLMKTAKIWRRQWMTCLKRVSRMKYGRKGHKNCTDPEIVGAWQECGQTVWAGIRNWPADVQRLDSKLQKIQESIGKDGARQHAHLEEHGCHRVLRPGQRELKPPTYRGYEVTREKETGIISVHLLWRALYYMYLCADMMCQIKIWNLNDNKQTNTDTVEKLASEQKFEAGRLKKIVHNWKQITSHTVQGVKCILRRKYKNKVK